MSTLELCIVALFAAALVYVWKLRTFYYASFKIKGPFFLPVIGNGLEFIGNTEDLLQSVTRMKQTYGTPLRLWVGSRFTVAITNPEDFEIILNSPNSLSKGESYRFLAEITGESIFTQENVSKWRQNRKLIATTFNIRILNSFIPIFEQQSLIFCEKLETMVGNGIFDVYPMLGRCTMDIIFETAMGAQVNAQKGNSEYMLWIDALNTTAFKRMFHVWYQFEFLFRWTKEGIQMRKYIQCVRDFNNNIIQAKRKAYKENKVSKPQQDANEDAPVKRRAFLDYLIEISEETGRFTDEELRDEVATFIIAGADSTAGTNGFALMMLGIHTEIQERVFEEQQEIFGGSDRPATSEDLIQMKYLERVIKETMRLFPAGALIGRKTTEDVKLRTCTVPKGSECVLGVYHSHRDPKLWNDPLRFDPDRFLPEEIAKRHPYSWIPFSSGPRNCLGLKYGMMSMKVLLSTVVRKYKVYCPYKSVEEVRVKLDLMLKAVEGHTISLEPRFSS